MFGYVQGKVLEITENSCVLLTPGGVGYEVFVPVVFLPPRGEEAAFYVSLVVREDAQELFGFPTWDERQTFDLLLGINRVGARTALALLTQFRPDDLRRIVAEDDVMALTQVSGIGKKSAQQIFLELKYKLKGEASLPAGGAQPGSIYKDALTGLMNLGYDEDHVRPILQDVLGKEPDLSVSEALRATLKALAKGK